MKAKLVNEAFKDVFKPKEDLSKEAKDILKLVDKLKSFGLTVNIRTNPYHSKIIDIDIDELEDHQVSYLPYEERHWCDKGSEDWAWGIYELDDGDLKLENEEDINVVFDKIIELGEKQ